MALEATILKPKGFSNDVLSTMIQAQKLISSKSYHREFLPKVASEFHIDLEIVVLSFCQNPASAQERNLHLLNVVHCLKFCCTKPFCKNDSLSSLRDPRWGQAASKGVLHSWKPPTTFRFLDPKSSSIPASTESSEEDTFEGGEIGVDGLALEVDILKSFLDAVISNMLGLSLREFDLPAILSFLQDELCIDDGIEFNREFVLDGQPLYIACPFQYEVQDENFNITWIKNGSQAPVTSDTLSRVHQNENYLKFIPAKLEDSIYYSCVLRLSKSTALSVADASALKNLTDRKLEAIFKAVFAAIDSFQVQECAQFLLQHGWILNMDKSAPIPSQDLVFLGLRFDTRQNIVFLTEDSLHQIMSRECQPLEIGGNKYLALANELIIHNVTLQDEGQYTCEVLFSYNGTDYTISRTTDFSLKVLPVMSPPAIKRPTNNILNVELGSGISLVCEVLFPGNDILILWTYNKTTISTSDDKRIIMGEMYFTDSPDGHKMAAVNMNFSEVKEEDYNKNFFCEIYSAVNSKAYVMLKPPDPNFQGFLIAFFVSLAFVIVIVIIIIKVFKIEIVLWYRRSCFAQRNIKDGKLYDAYIMYPKSDSGSISYTMDMFVLKVLPEVLERQCAYRLFILGRDEMPGKAVADVIDEAITQSRRLIIVLGSMSPENHLEDDFEQQIAMYDVLIRNKMKLILVELEKITDYSNMPESIKYIKQKQGAVQWKGDFTKATLSAKTNFWKNIRYRMPPTPGQHSPDLDCIRSEKI
ncbi:interleukin-1 receptor type 1-like [Rhinophrynus dorsalis]